MRALVMARGRSPPHSDLVSPNLGPTGHNEEERKTSTLDVTTRDPLYQLFKVKMEEYLVDMDNEGGHG